MATLLALALWLPAAPAPASADPLPAPPDLVDATQVVAGLRLDLRYATARNLVGRPMYRGARCLLRPETAAALGRAQERLRLFGLSLLAWDCYRPRRVQALLWAQQPTPGLVANPARGSNHNRGAAVDVALTTLDGSPVPLPTDFDDLGPRAARAAHDGIAPEALVNRKRLQAAMRSAGFTGIRREWWHFDLRGALSLPLLDAEP